MMRNPLITVGICRGWVRSSPMAIEIDQSNSREDCIMSYRVRVLAAAFAMILLVPLYSAHADEADDAARATCSERVAADQGVSLGEVAVEFAGRAEVEDAILVRGRLKRASGGEMMFNCLVGTRGDLAGQIVTLNYR
jgi:hypothetical protein